MKTIKFTIILLLSSVSFLHAQIKVDTIGKAIIGTPPDGTPDRYNVTSMMVYGKNGVYKAGSKISFGDFGSQENNGWNVFVGEYSDIDTDRLWLHGKKGCYLTYNRGYTENVIACYDIDLGNRFNFNCDVYANGIKVTSDLRFKENINKLENPLSSLRKLDGVSYNLIGNESIKASTTFRESVNSDVNKISQNGLTEKEMSDKAFFDEWDKNLKNNKETKLGFIAQDLQKIFPELVSEDKSGYLSVDYIGLIPVIIEGMKEQSRIIDAQSAKIKELEAQINDPGKIAIDIPVLKSTTTEVEKISSETTNAFLYQNVPNPFSEETEIRYFLPEETRQAYIYIFDMQGNLLKKENAMGQDYMIVKGTELHAGMYIYSLIVNGKEVDTKRMILTK